MIGYLEPNLANKFELPNVISHLNQGTIQDIVNLICSCNVYIGIEGFALCLAGMKNKTVYARIIHNNGPIDPDWNLIQINSLEEANV